MCVSSIFMQILIRFHRGEFFITTKDSDTRNKNNTIFTHKQSKRRKVNKNVSALSMLMTQMVVRYIFLFYFDRWQTNNAVVYRAKFSGRREEIYKNEKQVINARKH